MSLARAFDSVSRRAALAAIVLMFPILLMAQNHVFGPNVRVNDDSPGSHGHLLNSPGRRSIAVRGDTVYVAETKWNGHDDRGRTASPGVYLVRVLTRSGSETSQIRFLGK